MSSALPFAIAPGPWHLEGEAYWMLLKPLTSLPPAAYNPLEQPRSDDPNDKTSKFIGGLGVVWIVRYTSSPVGPYDELIYLPGEFQTPSGGKAPRVTLLYVSTPESVYNGRRNWNIPKHLAKFSFTPYDNNRTLIEVFDYYDDGPQSRRPFFAAIATPQRFVPAVPLSTRWLGLAMGTTALVHPPLPEGPADRPEEVGTAEWRAVEYELHGKAKLVWWEPSPTREGSRIPPGAYADGVGFPQIEVRSVGVWFPPGASLEFGAPLLVEGASAIGGDGA